MTHLDVADATLADLAAAMASRAASSRDITAACLERIAAIDAAGPRLSAVVQVNPDALAIADRLDAERRAGRVRGPLHGIPILLKDNVDTADGMETTAGSLALLGVRPVRDAFLVARLRDAGAVLLGKTNMAEWANIRSSHAVNGWSARGGFTRNPHALDRNPGGSSSGSGAAVAAGLAPAAVGTETDGSVVCPAAFNGVVGIKPTLGLVSRTGIIPISHSQDTAGSLGRTVADAALLLAAMAGVDPADEAASPLAATLLADVPALLRPDGLRGARIGVTPAFFGISDGVDAVGRAAVEALRDAGATIVEDVALPTLADLEADEDEVLLRDLRHDLGRHLQGLPPGGPRSLADVIAFNEAHRDEELRWFGQDLFLVAEAKGPLTDAAYTDARARCLRITRDEGIDRAIRQHRLDALFGPTGQTAFLTDLVNGDPKLRINSTLAAVSGYPHVTVPAGFVHGLPVGVSFVGPAFSDPVLIRLAHAFEQATAARRRPTFPPAVLALATASGETRPGSP